MQPVCPQNSKTPLKREQIKSNLNVAVKGHLTLYITKLKVQLPSSSILEVLPVLNLHAQTLRVNEFETSQCLQLSLIKEAEVWSSERAE